MFKLTARGFCLSTEWAKGTLNKPNYSRMVCNISLFLSKIKSFFNSGVKGLLRWRGSVVSKDRLIQDVWLSRSGNKAPVFDQLSWAALRQGKARSAFSEVKALDKVNRCFEMGCSAVTACVEDDAYLKPDSISQRMPRIWSGFQAEDEGLIWSSGLDDGI